MNLLQKCAAKLSTIYKEELKGKARDEREITHVVRLIESYFREQQPKTDLENNLYDFWYWRLKYNTNKKAQLPLLKAVSIAYEHELRTNNNQK